MENYAHILEKQVKLKVKYVRLKTLRRMYMCMYVCMYIHTYIHTYIQMYIYI